MKKMATTDRQFGMRPALDAPGTAWCCGILCGVLLLLCVPTAVRAEDAPMVAAPTLLNELGSAHPPLVLDVRSPEEYAEGHLPGALNIPHTEIEGQLARLVPYRDQDIVVYCRSGRRAGIALDLLKARGFSRLRHLEGDYTAWRAAGRPVDDEVIVPTVPH